MQSEEFEENDDADSSQAPSENDHDVESGSSSDNSDLEIDDSRTESPETLQELGEKFLLKIKHKNSLSAKTMHNIGCCTSELISATVTRLRKGLEKCLDSANMDMDEIEGLQDVFAESDDLCKATKTFSCMNVERNWKQGVAYVVSENVIISKNLTINLSFMCDRLQVANFTN